MEPIFDGYDGPAYPGTSNEEREKDMWRRMFDRLDLFLEVKELVRCARVIRGEWEAQGVLYG